MLFSACFRLLNYFKSFFLFFLIFLSQTYLSAQFVGNNLAILVSAASSHNNTVSVVEMDQTIVGKAVIQTIAIPGTYTNAIRVSSYIGDHFFYVYHISLSQTLLNPYLRQLQLNIFSIIINLYTVN